MKINLILCEKDLFFMCFYLSFEASPEPHYFFLKLKKTSLTFNSSFMLA